MCGGHRERTTYGSRCAVQKKHHTLLTARALATTPAILSGHSSSRGRTCKHQPDMTIDVVHAPLQRW